jgi:uncharacterized protein (DUF58 family)
MIVPRSRLLWWVVLVALPFALLGAVEPSALGISLACIGTLSLLAILDAALGQNVLSGIAVEFPGIARMSKGREAKLELRVGNPRQKQLALRMALPFPRELQAPDEELDVLLPNNTEWSRFIWPCKPLRRGTYHFDKVYLEAGSPLGFWGIRATVPTQAEVRVYPNLLTERKNLAALFLNRGTFGLHAQRQIGKGREFEKLREYIPGDSFDDIHWKATAKRGRPVTKVFQIERTQEVYVIIDSSRLSARVASPKSEVQSPTSVASVVRGQSSVVDGTGRASITTDNGRRTTDSTLERYVTAALVLGLAAEQQGDLFGLLTFSDRIETFVRAKNGKAHYHACRDALYGLQPRIVTPDFDEVCSFIRLRLRRRALLIFLTALDDPLLAESFIHSVDLIRHQHLVFVNMMQPPHAVPVFSESTVDSTDDLYRHLGGHLLWHNLRELDKTLQRRGVRFSMLDNEKLSAQLVSQYLGVKRRQLL